MRDELEDVLDLYEGMPPEGQEHWRERALPSVTFESDAEREEFVTALRERDKPPAVAPTKPNMAPTGSTAAPPAPASFEPRTVPGSRETPACPTGMSPGGVVVEQPLRPGQRVKANLAGLSAGAVQFSQNVEAAFATVDRQVSADPAVYRLRLLISFRGVNQVDVPADRIRPM